MSETISLNKTELRNFGIITGAIFAILFGLLLPWLFERGIPYWPWIIAGVLIPWALLHPKSLDPVYRMWMKIGHVLGWINTRIILSILFYAVFLPTGLIVRLIGKDLLKRKLENIDTYRVKSVKHKKEHIERPY